MPARNPAPAAWKASEAAMAIPRTMSRPDFMRRKVTRLAPQCDRNLSRSDSPVLRQDAKHLEPVLSDQLGNNCNTSAGVLRLDPVAGWRYGLDMLTFLAQDRPAADVAVSLNRHLTDS
jgi:hypothetical protein